MRKTFLTCCYIFLYVLAVVFLSFVAGSASYHFRFFPEEYLRQAFQASSAYFKRHASAPKYNLNLWSKTTSKDKGVTVYKRERAFEGYTLYTSGHEQAAFLVDMEGRTAHTWNLPFQKVWDNPPHVRFPVPSHQSYYRRAHLFDNGDLLAIYVGEGDTPWGYGLVKMDRNSNLIWSYADRVHHDLDIGEDGRIYTLTHQIRHRKLKKAYRITAPFLDDYIVILSPEGRELQRINILRAIRKSKFRAMLDTVSVPSSPLHTNSVKLVTEEIASRHPYVKAGDILVSMRNVNAIAAIDSETQKVVWAARGPWLGQHDPDFLENGNMLLFDNLGKLESKNRSRVVEFDPLTLQTAWVYEGSGERRFFSYWRSRQQRLPNGNTLITESDRGRLLEVTGEGEVVWEYINPVRGGDREQFIPILSDGQRIPADKTAFLDMQ